MSNANGHRPKQRRKQLRKLGLDERQINMVVSSRKGYWKLSRTLSTNMGMGNAWLAKQGLISLKPQAKPDNFRRK